MKKNSKLVGVCIMAAGAMILLACFLPPAVLVCVEAAIMIFVGFLYLSM